MDSATVSRPFSFHDLVREEPSPEFLLVLEEENARLMSLLRDDTSYGVAGDHGGAQEPVQRIPIVFFGAGVGKASPKGAMRSVDILPTILRELGLRATFPMDGRAYRLG